MLSLLILCGGKEDIRHHGTVLFVPYKHSSCDMGRPLCSGFYCEMTSPPISHYERVQVRVLRRILRMGAVWTPWLAPLRNTAYISLTTLLNDVSLNMSYSGLFCVAATCSFSWDEQGPLWCSSVPLPLRCVFIGFPVITLCLRWLLIVITNPCRHLQNRPTRPIVQFWSMLWQKCCIKSLTAEMIS